jgi:hypothetical protein
MFIYVMKTAQVAIMGIVCATLFLRTQLHPTSLNDGTKYAGITFFSLLIMLFNGIAGNNVFVTTAIFLYSRIWLSGNA